MKERIKYQGIEFEMNAGDPPDIMRPCVNPEAVNITPKVIEESIAKRGHEKIGGSVTISKEAYELAKKDDNEIKRILIEKIRQANKALIEAANNYYFRKLDE